MDNVTAPPALQAELIRLLKLETEENGELEGVHVTFGRPGRLPKALNWIYGQTARNWQLRRGEQHRIETFNYVLAIECFGPGDDEDAAVRADTARWDCVNGIHQVLRKSDLAGYQTKGLELQVLENTLTLYDKGWVAFALVSAGAERRVN